MVGRKLFGFVPVGSWFERAEGLRTKAFSTSEELGYGGLCPHPLKGLGRWSIKSNSLKEDIEGRKPAKTLAGPVVDQIKDPVKLRL